MSGKLDDIEFAEANYELIEIRDRLNKSVADAEKEMQRRRSNAGETDSFHKKNSVPAVEHAIISEWGKNGRWLATPYTIRSGGDNFVSDLESVIRTRKPDQIRVIIYKGKKADKPVYDQKISIKDPHAVNDAGNSFKGLEGVLEEIKTTVKGGDQSDLRLQVLKLEMQIENLKTKHEGEVREVNMSTQFEISRLRDTIDAQKKQLEEYESGDEDAELGGVEDNKLLITLKELAGGIISNASENFLRKNPELLKGLGLTDDVIEKFSGGSKQLSAPVHQSEASFSEAQEVSGIDLSGLAPKHAEGLANIIEVFKNLSAQKFDKICTVIQGLYDNSKEDIDENLVDKTLLFIIQTKSNKAKAAAEQQN